VTEIENFQKLTHLNQFSRQKHTHVRVWVILPQLPVISMTAKDKSLLEREEKTKWRVTTMILHDAHAAG
jgi:hypothetical protein